MRLSGKALAITSAALWGGGVLTVGLVNLAKPKYGDKALDDAGDRSPARRSSRP